MSEHLCFTASTTAYRPDPESDRPTWAIHYQKAPEKTERGENVYLRFPTLVIADYVSTPQEIAEKVARILNKHWDDAE